MYISLHNLISVIIHIHNNYVVSIQADRNPRAIALHAIIMVSCTGSVLFVNSVAGAVDITEFFKDGSLSEIAAVRPIHCK